MESNQLDLAGMEGDVALEAHPNEDKDKVEGQNSASATETSQNQRRKSRWHPVEPEMSVVQTLGGIRAESMERRVQEVAANGGKVPDRVVPHQAGGHYWLFAIEKILRFSLCDNCVKLYLQDDGKITPLPDGYFMLTLLLCSHCMTGNNESKKAYKNAFGKKWNGHERRVQPYARK